MKTCSSRQPASVQAVRRYAAAPPEGPMRSGRWERASDTGRPARRGKPASVASTVRPMLSMLSPFGCRSRPATDPTLSSSHPATRQSKKSGRKATPRQPFRPWPAKIDGFAACEASGGPARSLLEWDSGRVVEKLPRGSDVGETMADVAGSELVATLGLGFDVKFATQPLRNG